MIKSIKKSAKSYQTHAKNSLKTVPLMSTTWIQGLNNLLFWSLVADPLTFVFWNLLEKVWDSFCCYLKKVLKTQGRKTRTNITLRDLQNINACWQEESLYSCLFYFDSIRALLIVLSAPFPKVDIVINSIFSGIKIHSLHISREMWLDTGYKSLRNARPFKVKGDKLRSERMRDVDVFLLFCSPSLLFYTSRIVL